MAREASLDQQSHLQAAQSQLEATQLQLEDTRKALKLAKMSKEQTDENLAQLTETVQRNADMMKQREEEVDTLHSSHSEHQGRVAELTAELTAVRAELSAASTAAAEQLAAMKAQMAALQADNEAFEAARTDMEDDVARANFRAEEAKLTADKQYEELKTVTAAREEAANKALGVCRVAHSALGSFKAELRGLSTELKENEQRTMADLEAFKVGLCQRVGGIAREAAAADRRFKREARERRRVFNQLQEMRGNIRVFCRVRPILSKEAGAQPVVATEDDTGIVVTEEPIAGDRPDDAPAPAGKRFEFDRVFGAKSTQQEVYDEISPVVNSALDGFHCCIFAYGQTGSGKTHTMQGQTSEEQRGVYFRALSQLFEETVARADGCDFTLTVSMVEIYNETVRDLLISPGAAASELDIRTGPQGNYLPGVVQEDVHCPDDVQVLMDRGASNRSVGATNANEHSSRSHSLLMIDIAGKNKVTGAASNGRLVLVDLAGSERVSKSGATGQRMKEAQNINKSLSALGDVIGALTHKASHVPFRNSKLTHLLADSLGKDNKALMIVQVSPVGDSKSETMCSLNFASRVRKVEQGQAKKHGESSETAKLRSALARARGEAKAASTQVASMHSALSSLKAEEADAKAKAKAATASVDRLSKDAACSTIALRQRADAAEKELKEEKRARVELTKKLRKLEERFAKAEADADKKASTEARAAAKKAASGAVAGEKAAKDSLAAAERKLNTLAAENKALKSSLDSKDAEIKRALSRARGSGGSTDSARSKAATAAKALRAEVDKLKATLAQERTARKAAEAAAAAVAAADDDDDAASLVSSIAGGEDTLRDLSELQQAVRASLSSTSAGKRSREGADVAEAEEGGPSPSKVQALGSDDEGDEDEEDERTGSVCDGEEEQEESSIELDQTAESEAPAGKAFGSLNDTFDLRSGAVADTVVDEDSDDEDEYVSAEQFFSGGSAVSPAASAQDETADADEVEVDSGRLATAAATPKRSTSASKRAHTPGTGQSARSARGASSRPAPITPGAAPAGAAKVTFGSSAIPSDDCTPGRNASKSAAPQYSKRSAAGKSPKVPSILRSKAAARPETAPTASRSKQSTSTASSSTSAAPRVLGATGNTVRARPGKAPRASVYGMMGAAFKSVGIQSESSAKGGSASIYAKASRGAAGSTPARRRKASSTTGAVTRPASRTVRTRTRPATANV